MGLINLFSSYLFFIWAYFEGTTVGTTRELLGNYLGTTGTWQGTTFEGCSSRCSSIKPPPHIGFLGQS